MNSPDWIVIATYGDTAIIQWGDKRFEYSRNAPALKNHNITVDGKTYARVGPVSPPEEPKQFRTSR